METLKQTLFLLKTMYRNNRGLSGLKKKGEKRSQFLGKIAGIAIVCVVFGIMFVAQAVITGLTAAKNAPDKIDDYLSVFYFIAQAAILFLGLFATLGTLYFSKDNALLSTLPVKKSAVFASKFLYCYISELAISAVFVLVIVTAYAVGCIVGGAAISAWYFVIEILSIFLVPVIPLLIIAVLSIPMMYVVSFIKRSKTASVVLNTLITLLFVGICMIPAILNITTGMGAEEGEASGAMLGVYDALAGFTVFNLPLTSSMLLVNPAANFFLYFGATVAGFLLVIGLSVLTYPRILSSTLDGGTQRKKKNKKAEFKTLSFRKTYLKKEIKTLFSTPTLIANLVLPIVMLPLMIVLFSATGMFEGFSEGGEAAVSSFGAAGMVLYVSCLFTVVTNPIAMMGFSMEGKNIYFLKTLPLSAKEMVRMKLRIADLIDLFFGILIFVSFSAASPAHDVLLAAIIALIATGFGIAFNRFGLYNDLKKPALNWQNIQEINKNNKRSIKPMLICLVCCIGYIIVGFVLDGVPVAHWLKYVMLAAIGFLIDALIYLLTAKKLYDSANRLWEAIE